MLVHILAAGPSIRPYVAEGWPNGAIIGVNGTGLLCASLYAWCATDKMPQPVVEWAASFKGRKFVSTANQHQFPGAYVMKHWGMQGPLHFEQAEMKGFFWAGSSAMAACEIARLLMKATEIIVHGLDYQDNAHAYDYVDERLKRKEIPWNMAFLEQNWRAMYLGYQKMGVGLWNANPNSALQSLPKLESWRIGVPAKEERAV